jgi:peroxiredoxin
LQTTLTSVPSHAQPGLYALHVTPGDGKHEPVAEHPPAVGKPQSMPVPHCASAEHEPDPPELPDPPLVVPLLPPLLPELAPPLDPAPPLELATPPELPPPLELVPLPELAPLLPADPLEPSTPPSTLLEVDVEPPQPARATATAAGPVQRILHRMVTSPRYSFLPSGATGVRRSPPGAQELRCAMLRAGDVAPEIDATASDGTRFCLSEQKGKLCTVVYFFPKAFTPGCTREAEHFRDSYAEIALSGAAMVGISTDDAETQCEFARTTRAPFPMIADAKKKISKAYGVLWPVVGLPKRITFVVNRLRVVDAVFRHEVNIRKHCDDVLRAIDAMHRAQRG